MLIALPTNGRDLNAEIFFHFGRCSNYLLYDTDKKSFKVIKNTSDHMGGQGLPPEIIQKAGADIMIVADLGQRALQLFSQFGIEVYCQAQGKIKDVLKQFQEGKLIKANPEIICRHH